MARRMVDDGVFANEVHGVLQAVRSEEMSPQDGLEKIADLGITSPSAEEYTMPAAVSELKRLGKRFGMHSI